MSGLNSDLERELKRDSSHIKLSVVIPCFNEEARLRPTIEEIWRDLPAILKATFGQDAHFEIVCVDDGSSDGTASIIRELEVLAAQIAPQSGVQLISYTPNRGKGAAVRAGCEVARGQFVLLADADGSTPIAEIARLFPSLLNGSADIAIGSRALPDSSVKLETKLHRKLLGRFFHQIVRILLPGLQDTQCGFKLLNRPVVHEIVPGLKVDHFGFDIELLYHARLAGMRITEVAVSWHHMPGSKVHLVRDSLRMLSLVLKLRLQGWTPTVPPNQR